MGIHIVPGNSSWYLAKIWYLVLLRSKRKTEAISLRVAVEEEEEEEESGSCIWNWEGFLGCRRRRRRFYSLLNTCEWTSLCLSRSPLKFVLKILTCGRVTGGDNFRAAAAATVTDMDSSSSEHRTDTPSLDYSMPLFLSRSRDDGENSETMKKLEKRTIIVLTEGEREGLNWGFLPRNVSSLFLPFLPAVFPLRCHSRVRCCSRFSHILPSFLPSRRPLPSRSSRCR